MLKIVNNGVSTMLEQTSRVSFPHQTMKNFISLLPPTIFPTICGSHSFIFLCVEHFRTLVQSTPIKIKIHFTKVSLMTLKPFVTDLEALTGATVHDHASARLLIQVEVILSSYFALDLIIITHYFYLVLVRTLMSLFHTKNQTNPYFYVGYSESKYRLRISLAQPRDCHFAHVQ